MQTLLAISVLSFLGVVWAAIAFAKHIKAGPRPKLSVVPKSRTVRTATSRPDFKQHLFAVPETAIAAPEVTFVPEATAHRTRASELNQSVHEIAANKQWSMPPQPNRGTRQTIHRIQPGKSTLVPNPDRRKPPQAARHGNMELLDPAYFNKDMGDLTDPHQPIRLRANDRTKPVSPRHF